MLKHEKPDFKLSNRLIKKYEKPGKPVKHGKTQAERAHLNWVASQPCIVCGSRPVNVHHVRSNASKRDHFKTIPLCYLHHQGNDGIHFLGKRAFYARFGHELDMLKRLEEAKWLEEK